ncbi:putative lactoylglutathione lyase [Halobacteriovorax marinus SJ]|uniref:Lactoylglutathione lyase n=1 Tax=Halobacteriovorax marinus (strain ATCC BAA-682 / DSM 15412 / SJ) TaxID=862908 RepID=E1WZ59_HALMS|nr:methylmalonyl-CoA epimerase [Halobacteriovorax marinus]CBW26156.1 putative lactoylglutathione lyase [Halobacteriovorax marinus SJ]
MIGKDCVLDHVAIAVKDLDKSQRIWEDMGLSFSTKREVVESQGVTTAFAQMDENAHLELLCPYGENGPIHKFLEKKGEGIHHLCFKVKDVVAKCDELREKGYTLLNEQPINGANNCLVNFIHPKSTGGVLVEVSQKKA